MNAATETRTATTINATLTKNARRIFANIARHSGAVHCGTIAQDISLSIPTIKRHVNALCAAGLVEVVCYGRKVPEGVDVEIHGQIGGGFVGWSQKVVPSATWSREGETDLKSSENSYVLSLTSVGCAGL